MHFDIKCAHFGHLYETWLYSDMLIFSILINLNLMLNQGISREFCEKLKKVLISHRFLHISESHNWGGCVGVMKKIRKVQQVHRGDIARLTMINLK